MIWKVNVNTGAVSTSLMRFDGLDRPKLPVEPPQDESDDWAKAFYRAYRPVGGDGVVVIPFAKGYPNNSDGQAVLVRSPQGKWLAVTDTPMIMAVTDSDLVESAVSDSGAVRINFYRAGAEMGAQTATDKRNASRVSK